jgi:hypothetical protein
MLQSLYSTLEQDKVSAKVFLESDSMYLSSNGILQIFSLDLLAASSIRFQFLFEDDQTPV